MLSASKLLLPCLFRNLISPLSLAIAHQNVSAAGKKDGAVDLTVIGGVGPYTYRWNTGA